MFLLLLQGNSWDSWCPNEHRGKSRQSKGIIEVKSPKTMKEVQSLTGKVVALNIFISRATDKCMPFFKGFEKGLSVD